MLILVLAFYLADRRVAWVYYNYKKSLSDKIIHVSSHNRRVSGIIVNFTSNCSCLLLSVLITLSRCITQLTVVHLYIVEIIIVLLIDRTHKPNF